MRENEMIFNEFMQEQFQDYVAVRKNGYTIFVMNKELRNGPQAQILIAIDDNDTVVEIFTGQFLKVYDRSKCDQVFRILNELNLKYPSVKFHLQENNEIRLSSHVLVPSQFDPGTLIAHAITISEAMETEYLVFAQLIS